MTWMDETYEMQHGSAQFVAVNARPPSTSYVPRPVSGTAIRVSSSSLSQFDQKEVDPQERVSTEQSRRPSQFPHRTCRTDDGMPPTSFSIPRAKVPQSGSSTIRNRLASIARSDVQQTSQHAGPSSRRLSSIGKSTIVSAIQDSASAMPIQLSAKKREITPRTLMRPIHPYLPQSRTMSCLTYSAATPLVSPSKPTHQDKIDQTSATKSRNKAYMSNIAMNANLNQYKKDLQCNTNCSNSENEKSTDRATKMVTSDTRPSDVQKDASTTKHLNTPITLNLSINDVANTRRLEEQRQRFSSKRPLFINTTLANTVKITNSSPLTYSAPLSGATYYTKSSSEGSPDLRNVYCLENTGYWTGRYVSTSDRLRQRDCETLLKSKDNNGVQISINSQDFEARFDKLEASRQSRVFKELRLFCMTENARKSLKEFELLMEKKDNKSSLFVRSYSELFTKPVRDVQPKTTPRNEPADIRHDSDNKASNQPNTSTAQATIEKLSGIIARKGGLIKSKTTGNIALKSASTRAPTPGSLHPSGLSRKERKLAQDLALPSSEASAAVGKDAGDDFGIRDWIEQESVKLAGTEPLLPNDVGAMSNCLQPPGIVVGRKRDWYAFSPSIPPSTTKNPIQDDPSKHGVGGTVAFKKLPKILPITTHNYADAEANVKETILDQANSRSRQSSGQSSGEFVKKVLGASVREVRKMSRKVGSIG